MKIEKVQITPEESENIENLFLTYNSYMSMLEFLATSGDMSDSPLYDKKWNEASKIWIDLDKAKRAVELKYKPKGDWARYEFDFDNNQVVFIAE